MIPVRIQVAGFLCYREPQEACFEGRTLWMLAGPNGSGKSALFDAVTYALFGQHRGGRHNARGLIHHDCDRLAIEFDFAIDDQLFRARRSLSRQGRATRQIRVRSNDEQTDGESWADVTGTHTERGFAQWIEANLALNFETFTASVLLLQGKADNLLLATPAQRHRLLCQVVGLDRIEQFAQRAQRNHAHAEGTTRAYRDQLQQVESGTKNDLHLLARQYADAQQDLVQRSSHVEQLKQTLDQATHWQQLTSELRNLFKEIEQQSTHLEQLQQYEQQQRHEAVLAIQITALRRLLDHTTRISQCRVKLDHLETEHAALQGSVDQIEHDLHEVDQAVATARTELDAATAREKQLTRQHAQQTRTLAAVVRFTQTRDKLRQLDASHAALQTQLKKAVQEQATLRSVANSDNAVRETQETARIMTVKLTEQELRTEHLRQQLARLRSVAGSATCPYCRQSLDHSRCQQEKQQLARGLQDAEAALKQARHACGQANEHERRSRDEHERQQQRAATIQQQILQLTAQVQTASAVEQEVTDQCRQAYQELPLDLRSKIAGEKSCKKETVDDTLRDPVLVGDQPVEWRASTFPQTEHIGAMQQGVHGMARELNVLAQRCPALRQRLDQYVARQQTLTAQRQATARTKDQCSQCLAQLHGELSGLVTLQDASRSSVPPPWRDLVAEDIATQIRSLEASCRPARSTTESSYDDTAKMQTTQHVQTLQTRHDMLQEQVDTIPAAARRNPQELASQLRDAQQLHEQAEGEVERLRDVRSQAQQHYDRRQALLEQLRSTQQQGRRWQRIAKLLGRDGLQRALLETAEQAIVQYANTILDRLTGGKLYVELARADHGRAPVGKTPAGKSTAGRVATRKVLDLVARTTGANTPKQDVAFLSGSQKFRVAVALSLAIGQFASNARRPVQAVIIDEGFGCLDTTNRQVMVQELQNLRGHLQRILLVSHQDEFVSAFPDGYRCEMVDGATRLTPFHA